MCIFANKKVLKNDSLSISQFPYFQPFSKTHTTKASPKSTKAILWLCLTNAFYAVKHAKAQVQLLCYGGQLAIGKNGCYGCPYWDIRCTTDRFAVT